LNKVNNVELTEEQKKSYIKNDYGRCPVCKSDDIEGRGSYESDGNWISHEIICNNCDFAWQDIYELTDIEPV